MKSASLCRFILSSGCEQKSAFKRECLPIIARFSQINDRFNRCVVYLKETRLLCAKYTIAKRIHALAQTIKRRLHAVHLADDCPEGTFGAVR